jgi:phospholipid/cholesterol/gamma-HCH transport system substrate-binding protein
VSRRSLLPRMIGLVVVVVVGVYYIVFDVLGYRVTSQPFAVTVLMPSAGGLYSGADVTYRGVTVGTVTALDLSASHVAVKIGIDPGNEIPDNGQVYVKQLSALGEQYIDFQPASSSGPDLGAGTVIPASRVVLPTPIGTALVDLGALLKSLNPKSLQTVESFLSSAFVGTGPALRTIIVTGQRLFDSLVAAQPETVNLIVDGKTDLHTLQATDADLSTFSKGLASLTGQLKDSNSDLQGLIRNSQAAEQQLNPFLVANSASIAEVISSLATDAHVSNQFNAQVREIFQLLPIVSDDLAAVAGGGVIHGVLDINTEDPVCPYVIGAQMAGPTQKVADAPLDNSCPTSAPNMLQRGANSAG